MELRIFFSWQSDLPNRSNRNFIENAINQAVKNIKKDNSIEIEPVIDRDTSGLSGSPDIAKAILSKIEKSDIFIGDVSFIGEVSLKNSDKKKRKIPNPNVLIELGYAIGKIGIEKILMVMNTHWGEPEDLPFDLKMNRTIKYKVNEDEQQDNINEKNNFIKTLETAIKSIIKYKENIKKALENKNPIVMEVTRNDINRTSEKHHYMLFIKLTNTGKQIIKDNEFHIDVSMPSAFIEWSKPLEQYVIKGRKDPVISHIRINGFLLGNIYQGDSVEYRTITYYVDNDLYLEHRDLFIEEVTVTLYVDGFDPIIFHKKFQELQDF